jgi:hypothetical protein
MRIEFLKSTPERRAHIAHIKALFGEAYAAREADDIPAYAHRLADIRLVLAAFDDPKQTAERWLDARKGAAIIRRCRDVTQLDDSARSMAERTALQEDRLRIGFEVEMTGGVPPEVGGLV